MKHGLGLRATAQLSLTPQLQQSIRLLQLSTLEVAQEIEQMLADNPFLERAEEVDDPTAEADVALAEAGDVPANADALGGDAALPDTVAAFEVGAPAEDWPARLDDDAGGWNGDTETSAEGSDWSLQGPGVGRAGRDLDDDSPDATEVARAPERLADHLHRQALALHLDDDERAALYFLIESLDDDGYLSEPLEALTEALWQQLLAAGGAASAGAPARERHEEIASLLRRALGWLQSMEPTGVGARDLAECLRLQILELPNTPAAQAALALCAQPLEWIARRDTRRLAQATGLDEGQVRAGLALLSRLEPKPGRRFADAERQVVVPDVIVTVHGTQFDVQLNPAVLPRLRVTDLYAQALRGHRGGDLQARLQEARWFVKNLQQRFDTILRVARAIVDRQRNFFLHGEVGMRPLVLRDIADEVGLHESTISRVTTAKYMATPFGTFELKYFFGSSLGTDAGGNASSTAVRALIRQMIAAEDPRKPLSDGQLAELLKEQGIECARRTVAKYREALRIPPASLRKTL
ncbi:RNA polymerase sigma-54 factor [Tepidimonas thermarum]|uniref:RNA polymerase sigma-54 factor n=1 Tax=Tepidimonas thermarum TaxID=335431 RepID=A0A554X3M6_9BURK|nr:RNA polymerase factor sigma-54 [Tepidimonas thermarum]TSE30405.1 RNA polymerase sigma-54 factor [Tepidimonas thermarum]